MADLIERDKVIEAIVAWTVEDRPDIEMPTDLVGRINALPSAQPDFSCKGCQTPKHICGICMRNYPNITDHYTGGEAG